MDAEQLLRRAESAERDAVRFREAAGKLSLSEAERLGKVQRETMVAMFDGDTQVTDWVPFADGKAPLPDQWLDARRAPHAAKARGGALRMRTRDGKPLRASTSVQEHIVRSYAITWRTVW